MKSFSITTSNTKHGHGTSTNTSMSKMTRPFYCAVFSAYTLHLSQRIRNSTERHKLQLKLGLPHLSGFRYKKKSLLILSPQDAESLFREEDFEFELKDTTTVKHTSALVEHTERSILVIDTRALAADIVALQRTSPG